MPQPFRVRDGDDPGTDVGGWDEDGNIDVPGEVTASGGATLGAAAVQFPYGEYGPGDAGYLAWNGDPFQTPSSVILAAGTIYVQRLLIRRAVAPTKASFAITVAAATVTADQNFLGIYSPDGALLDSTDIDALVDDTGAIDVDIAPGECAPPYVYVALLTNATTPPTLTRWSTSSTIPNAGPLIAGATLRSAVAATGATELPATITPGTLTSTGQLTWWCGLWR